MLPEERRRVHISQDDTIDLRTRQSIMSDNDSTIDELHNLSIRGGEPNATPTAQGVDRMLSVLTGDEHGSSVTQDNVDAAGSSSGADQNSTASTNNVTSISGSATATGGARYVLPIFRVIFQI